MHTARREPSERPAGDRELVIYERVVPALAVSVVRLRSEVRQALARCDLAVDRHDEIVSVVSEAATNAVVHAYACSAPGPVYASATLADDSLMILICDGGHRGMLSHGTSRGLGVPLMTALADALEISCDPAAGTCVQATFEHASPSLCHAGLRPHAASHRSDRKLLRTYLRLGAAHSAPHEDTRAVLADARQTVAHARQRRREYAAIPMAAVNEPGCR